MTYDPVHRVSAVGGAQGALAALVNERIRAFGIVEALHQILVGLSAPVAVDLVKELLSVAGRAPRMDQYDHIAIGSKKLEVPPIRPHLAPHDRRATVAD